METGIILPEVRNKIENIFFTIKTRAVITIFILLMFSRSDFRQMTSLVCPYMFSKI